MSSFSYLFRAFREWAQETSADCGGGGGGSWVVAGSVAGLNTGYISCRELLRCECTSC